MGKVSTWSRPEVKDEKEEQQKAERLQEEIEVKDGKADKVQPRDDR